MAELGATTRRADREALKDFITTRTVTVRKSFGRHDTTKPALASLIGTINNESGFLNDPTGSRRFLVVTVKEIDWDYSDLDPHQVWAQAHALYQAGESGRLTKAERALQQTLNAGYEVDDPLEDWLLRHFDIDLTADTFTSSADIVKELGERGMRGTTRAIAMSLASTAKRLGLEKVRHGGQRGYRGVSLKQGGSQVGSDKRIEF